MKSNCWSLLPVLLAACAPSGGGGGDFQVNHRALVVTSDYQTGSWAVVEPGREPRINVGVIHADAVCRSGPGWPQVFIVSRLGADAVEVLDPDSLEIDGEYSLGAGSNPQDIALVGQRAFVPLYARAEVAVVEAASGTRLDGVDLAALADDDGIPEAAWAVAVGGEVFVALQRLDNFQPSDHSAVAIIDAASGELTGSVRLSGSDPFGRMRYSAGAGGLVLAEVGRYGELDGGVEILDPDARTVSGFLVSEAQLGGDVLDAVMPDNRHGFAVVARPDGQGGMNTAVVEFTSSGSVTTLAAAAGFFHSFIELSPDGAELWVTDRNPRAPGIRVFAGDDGRELTSEPVPTGLPPFMVCFVEEATP
ncbi:MAG: hypothetical protein DRI34_03080 [Deltaproteobacteria bacterium]|nr:MAG: hypothetical protein DRI34_03080 [Deltaproteobacteria bacterium]